jgi:hypothetical protein
MLERVDTRHRWLDILPAGGVVRHVFFGHFTGGRGASNGRYDVGRQLNVESVRSILRRHAHGSRSGAAEIFPTSGSPIESRRSACAILPASTNR